MHHKRLPRLAPLHLSLLLLLGACHPESRNNDSERASLQQLQEIAANLDQDFAKCREAVEGLAVEITDLYARKDEILPTIDRSKYVFSSNGSFYKPVDDGGAALWISGAVPIDESVKEVAYFTEPIDASLIRICKELPEVSQAYYNDRNSLNRIYPWFETISQYPAKMDIPSYNFYYLADEQHDPSHKGTWVNEPYVDPAGRGWMISTIAPVYWNDQLVGVPGLDITISAIIDRYFKTSDTPYAVVGNDGMVVAATEKAIELLEMPPLKDHKYIETIKQDTFQPDEYNILKSTLRPIRKMAKELIHQKQSTTRVELTGSAYFACAAPLKELNWTVLQFIKE